jgi:hypothetical protein
MAMIAMTTMRMVVVVGAWWSSLGPAGGGGNPKNYLMASDAFNCDDDSFELAASRHHDATPLGHRRSWR